MRRDKDDTRGRIPPEHMGRKNDTSFFEPCHSCERDSCPGWNCELLHTEDDTEQQWQLTEARVYDAMWKLKTVHLANSGTGAIDRMQSLFGEITPVEKTAFFLYGHWVVYGWETTKPMVRELYPGIVNNHISSTISGIGKEMHHG